MSEIGGDSFPPSLIESIDWLVRLMHPATKADKEAARHGEPDKQRSSIHDKAQVFSGLALPDKPAPARDPIDDTLAALEALESRDIKGKPGTRKRKRDRSRSPSRSSVLERHSRDGGTSESHSHKRSRYDRGDGCDERDRPKTYRPRRHRRAGGDDDSWHEETEAGYGFGRQQTEAKDDVPVMHKIYDGHVTGIKDFGVFVNLHGVEGKVDGLIHVSRLAEERISHPSDVVQRGQAVKVKVVSIEGTRIGLSMKDADEETSHDLAPQANFRTGANAQALGGRNKDTDGGSRGPDRVVARNRKRLTSPERWEIRQLIASGVAKACDYPNLEEDYRATLDGDGDGDGDTMALEEDVDIEIRAEEPPFLAGQTKQSLELSPIRIVKAPDGSLNRAALSGTALVKERQELRQQEAEAAVDGKAGQKDL